MEYRENNIFYNIVRNETTLTEVFCNLMRFKAFRILFLEFVNDKSENLPFNFQSIEYEDFETEKDFKFSKNDIDTKVGRGDLILTVDERDYIFELKIETTTRTTVNQPNGYFEYLQEQDKNDKNHKKRLFFLLPKDYKHKNSLKDVIPNNILYWEDFLISLKNSELPDLNIVINEFYNIVYETWFYIYTIKFNAIELDYLYNLKEIEMHNDTIPNIMTQLFTIIEELESSYKKSYKLKVERGSFEFGFYIKDASSNFILFVGIDFTLWKEKQIPLAVGLEDNGNEYSKKFKNIYRSELIEMKYDKDKTTYQYLPIHRKNLESGENGIPEIIKFINKVLLDIKL